MKTKLYKVILIVIFILPFFYEYFTVLPVAFKWLNDIVIFVFGFLYFKSNFKYLNKIMNRKMIHLRGLIIYTILSTVFLLISSLLNYCPFILLLLTLKKTFVPLILYLIILIEISKNNFSNIYDLYKKIFVVQLVLIPIEYLYFLEPSIRKYLVDSLAINELDIACGTLGAGQTGILGMILVCFFLFTLFTKQFFKSLLCAIPLIFINSGGAVILFCIVYLLFILLGGVSVKKRLKILIATLIIVPILFEYSTDLLGYDLIDRYQRSYLGYYDNIVENKATWAGENETADKLDRIAGYFYVLDQFNAPMEVVFGLSPQKLANSKTLGIKSSGIGEGVTDIKNDFLYILIEKGFVGIIVLYGLIILMIFNSYSKMRNRALRLKKVGLFNLIFALALLIMSFYVRMIYHYQLIAVIVTFMAFFDSIYYRAHINVKTKKMLAQYDFKPVIK
ncbi:hypothetical protein [Marinifilum sp.]|uniref:hypothetical protein n=1 Tax=Marinifilum sp. TaxID=2033137 RepID=UPI003BAB3932